MLSYFFVGQVFLLTSIAALLASSTVLNEGSSSSKNKYYMNKKGSQVIEISSNNYCNIYHGENAKWMRDVKKSEMKELNFIQFRLMVGKCQLHSLFNPDQSEVIINRSSGGNWTLGDSSQNQKQTQVFDSESSKTTSSILPPEEQEKTEETPGLPLIFPGTKWCGRGSVARSNDDLGIYTHTDVCCREHDQCPKNIPTQGCMESLCNDSEFTRSHCDCDEKFRQCLRQDRTLSSLASFKIANLYFNILKPLCFAKRHPVKWCRNHRITGECTEYEFDFRYPTAWQFFPAQPYRMNVVENLIQNNGEQEANILSISSTVNPSTLILPTTARSTRPTIEKRHKLPFNVNEEAEFEEDYGDTEMAESNPFVAET